MATPIQTAPQRAARRPVTSDPSHPDFPHGTARRYLDGRCRCNPCKDAATLARKQWEHRRLTGRLGPNDRVSAERARARLRALVDQGYEYADIARAAGISKSQVRRHLGVASDGTPHKMFARMAHAILTADMTTVPPRVPAERYWQRAYSLAAAGYPLAWIARQLGMETDRLHFPRRDLQIPLDGTFGKLERLYREISHVPAEVNQDFEFTPRQIQRAKFAARKHGFHPPGCYDDDGRLIPEAIRDEKLAAKFAERDRQAQRRLTALRMCLAGVPGPAVAEHLRVDAALVQRYCRQAGLAFAFDPYTDRSVPRPECAERATEIREILAAHTFLSDPFETVRVIGLMGEARYAFDTPTASADPASGESESDRAA